MNDQHRATPEQWDRITDLGGIASWSCILELRARVEALEAAQRPSPAPTGAPTGSLVERVMLAGGMGLTDSARAAIREVAAWLRDRTDGYASDLLDGEIKS